MAKAARPSSDLQSGDKLIARPVLTKRELQSVGPRRVLRARQSVLPGRRGKSGRGDQLDGWFFNSIAVVWDRVPAGLRVVMPSTTQDGDRASGSIRSASRETEA